MTVLTPQSSTALQKAGGEQRRSCIQPPFFNSLASPGHCVTVTAHLFALLKGMSNTTLYARRSSVLAMRRSQ